MRFVGCRLLGQERGHLTQRLHGISLGAGSHRRLLEAGEGLVVLGALLQGELDRGDERVVDSRLAAFHDKAGGGKPLAHGLGLAPQAGGRDSHGRGLQAAQQQLLFVGRVVGQGRHGWLLLGKSENWISFLIVGGNVRSGKHQRFDLIRRVMYLFCRYILGG